MAEIANQILRIGIIKLLYFYQLKITEYFEKHT